MTLFLLFSLLFYKLIVQYIKRLSHINSEKKLFPAQIMRKNGRPKIYQRDSHLGNLLSNYYQRRCFYLIT